MRTSSGPHAGVLLRRIEPIYPPTAAAGRVEGIVAMQVVIGKDGKVHNVKVLSGPKLLVEAAVDAVKLWRYEPAVVDGKLVESRQYVQLTFKLHSH
jgi:protein TonB